MASFASRFQSERILREGDQDLASFASSEWEGDRIWLPFPPVSDFQSEAVDAEPSTGCSATRESEQMSSDDWMLAAEHNKYHM